MHNPRLTLHRSLQNISGGSPLLQWPPPASFFPVSAAISGRSLRLFSNDEPDEQHRQQGLVDVVAEQQHQQPQQQLQQREDEFERQFGEEVTLQQTRRKSFRVQKRSVPNGFGSDVRVFAEVATYNPGASAESRCFEKEKSGTNKEGGGEDKEAEDDGKLPVWVEILAVVCDGLQRMSCHGTIQRRENVKIR